VPQNSQPNSSRILVALISVILFATACALLYAQHEKPKAKHIKHVFACQPENVVIDPVKGPSPDPLLVCPGDAITWCMKDGANTRFWVQFETSPFDGDAGGPAGFDERDCKATKPPTVITSDGDNWGAYKYTLIVNHKYFDPHVIIVPGSIEGQ